MQRQEYENLYPIGARVKLDESHLTPKARNVLLRCIGVEGTVEEYRDDRHNIGVRFDCTGWVSWVAGAELVSVSPDFVVKAGDKYYRDSDHKLRMTDDVAFAARLSKADAHAISHKLHSLDIRAVVIPAPQDTIEATPKPIAGATRGG